MDNLSPMPHKVLCDMCISLFVICLLISTNGYLVVWVGGLDSWGPLMKGTVT